MPSVVRLSLMICKKESSHRNASAMSNQAVVLEQQAGHNTSPYALPYPPGPRNRGPFHLLHQRRFTYRPSKENSVASLASAGSRALAVSAARRVDQQVTVRVRPGRPPS